MPKVNFNGRQFSVPRSRMLRIGIGIALIVFGTVGFLPIVGFWMIPVGLLVLSVDFAWARRIRRRSEVAVLRRWRGRTDGKPSENGDRDGPAG